MLRIVLAVLVSTIVASACCQAQTGAPGSTATRPAGRRGAISSSPRDQVPFTNSSLTGLNAKLPTLFITGDSTAATGDPDHRGWAAILVDYFDTSKVNLVNQAQGGARFNTYLSQGRWQRVVDAIKPGDYVVIQFGHNSGPLAGVGEETQMLPERGAAPATAPATTTRPAGATTLMHTHGWYVRKFAADVKAKGGIPIVMTLTLRNYWKDGKVERLKELQPGGGGMSDWTRQVAQQEHLLLVDHSNIIGDRYDALGKNAVAKYFAGAEYLHTDTEGAIVNCEAFIAGLKDLDAPALTSALNEKGKAVGAYHPSGM